MGMDTLRGRHRVELLTHSAYNLAAVIEDSNCLGHDHAEGTMEEHRRSKKAGRGVVYNVVEQ